MDIIELLDKAKLMSSSPTDMAMAAKLGVTRAAISDWRNGKKLPAAVTCAKLSDITGEPLNRVLGTIGEARAISKEEKKVWRRLAQVAMLIISIVPVLGLTSSFLPSLYIMSTFGVISITVFLMLRSRDELLRSRSPDYRYAHLQPHPLAGKMAWVAFSR